MMFTKVIAIFTLLNAGQALKKYSALIDVAVAIIDSVYLRHSTTFKIIKSSSPTSPRSNLDFEDLMDEILIRENGRFIVQLNDYLNVGRIKHGEMSFDIILLDSIELFWIINKKFSSENFNLHGFYLFILLNGNSDQIDEIFAALWNKNVFNVDVIYEANDCVDVVTFFPFSQSICGNISPKLINRFCNGSFTEDSESFFPDKFKNLASCTLNVSTFEEKLSVIRKPSMNGTFELSGFDMDLLHELSKALNFKTNISFIECSEPWGGVFANGSTYGAIGSVVDGRAQMAIAAYLRAERVQFADSSIVYFSFPEVFILSAEVAMTSFEKLLQPLDSSVWIMFCVSTSSIIIVIFVLSLKHKGDKLNHPAVTVAIIIFGGSQRRLPQHNLSRFVLMTFLIACLVIRNGYQGSLFKFLQSEGQAKHAETIEEMINQGFEIFMYPSQAEIFKENYNSDVK